MDKNIGVGDGVIRLSWQLEGEGEREWLWVRISLTDYKK